MPPNHRDLADDLAQSLKTTTTLMDSLLGEIRDNATSLAVLKEKMDILGENVQYLSNIVRNGNGQKSILTRLALIEHAMIEIKEHIGDNSYSIKTLTANTEKIEELEREKSLTKLKIFAVTIPGFLALALVIIKFFTDGS